MMMFDKYEERRGKKGDSTNEHEVPAENDKRHELRRTSDRQRMDALTRLQHEPLTFKRLAALFTFFVFLNQAANWWRANNVTPETMKATNERLDVTNEVVNRLAKAVDSLNTQITLMGDGNNFIFYSICVSLRRQTPESYPRFCERNEIQRYSPTR